MRPIYLDYMATTPMDPRVYEVMLKNCTMDGNFGNASSRAHIYGWKAQEAVDMARQHVADLIHAQSREIIFTSGATESNNLAIQGAAKFYQRKGNHIITVRTEHQAVLATCQALEREGFAVTYLDVDASGCIDLAQLEQAITEHTLLISVMLVNNETGVVQDIKAISKLVKSKGALLHVDAAQGAGKMPMDVNDLNVDLLSLSAHKLYGPKGVGALYIRREPRVRLKPLFYGGSQEQGIRPGTLATQLIIAMGEAFRIAHVELAEEEQRITAYRDKLWQGVKDLEAIYLNGLEAIRIPGVLNLSVGYVDGEALMMGLQGLAISSGSACNSATIEPSHVLKAMGVEDGLAHASIRLSIGRFTTEEEIDFTVQHLIEVISKLRNMSPLWLQKEGKKNV